MDRWSLLGCDGHQGIQSKGVGDGRPSMSLVRPAYPVNQDHLAEAPHWFVPKTLHHTLATWLRQRSVPAWEVAGLLGHHAGGTTDAYAKLNPSYLGPARAGPSKIVEQLAIDVPKLSLLLTKE